MTTKHMITFYPVGNGDTAKIETSTGIWVLFDFRHCAKAEDPATPEIDLKKHLRMELDKASRNHFDVVAFTHADDDHIRGSSEFFELRHARKYQGGGRVEIETLWVPAAMLLEPVEHDERSEEFALWKKEAWYRLVDEGKGVLVFSKPQEVRDELERRLKEKGLPQNARDLLFVDAGDIVPGLDLDRDLIEVFAHAPFIEHCEGGDIVRNSAGLVLNVRLKTESRYFDFLEMGDSNADDIEGIVRATRKHDNDHRLRWNLYNLPHHCSYKGLNVNDKGEKETVPQPLVDELLRCGCANAYMVSSSNPIPDNDDAYDSSQPPHIQARKTYQRYLNNVGGRSLLVTMEVPNETKPQPIVFEVSIRGLTLIESVAASAPVIFVAPRAGHGAHG